VCEALAAVHGAGPHRAHGLRHGSRARRPGGDAGGGSRGDSAVHGP
jgi:hypothetical protein